MDAVADDVRHVHPIEVRHIAPPIGGRALETDNVRQAYRVALAGRVAFLEEELKTVRAGPMPTVRRCEAAADP